MQRTEVLQQKLEHWCAASIRALAGDPSVHYRAHNLFLGEEHFPLHAPYLQLDFTSTETKQLRGVADAIALRLRHSNPELHKEHSPEPVLQKLVFELLEQLRTESLAPAELPGIMSNLRNRFLFWAQQAATSKLVENDIGLLVFTLTVMAWSRLMLEPIPEQIEDAIESTRWGLAESIGADLRTLKNMCEDQLAFAQHAVVIAKMISEMAGEIISSEADAADIDEQLNELISNKSIGLKWLDSESEVLQQHFAVSESNAETVPVGFEYSIFTKKYDREVAITKLIRAEQLKTFRTQLDKRLRQQSVNTHRVARYMKALVASPTLSGWSFGEEEGYLDASRLTRLITSPNERKLFRKEDKKFESDCIVSVLIDNSGSMNHHNEALVVMVDTLAKALELAGIGTEILGFTTNEWNGGRVIKDWNKAGKPAKPGRLNSLQHTIYKDITSTWRRSRAAIAGMLRTDLFREGIDGEALLWASERIVHRSERRKIVLVISDGSPMDTATLKANEERYLDYHLTQVVKMIENQREIQVCALGVGLDLSAYYQQSLAITLDDELTTNDYFAIAELLKRTT